MIKAKSNHLGWFKCSVWLGVALFSGAAQASVIYVDTDNNSGTETGTSWSTAYTELSTALASAVNGDEIWVAQGTYYPSQDDDRSDTFQMIEGVDIYGGFQGSEASVDERDWETYETILSGAIGESRQADNSYHILKGANDATIDGFFVEYANARGESSSKTTTSTTQATTASTVLESEGLTYGGGMLNFQTAPTVKNMVFRYNWSMKGGAVYNMAATSIQSGDYTAPSFYNVTFQENYAVSRGGGVANDLYTHPYMERVTFIDNYTDAKGGGMYNDWACSPTLVNCLFSGNDAFRAGAMGNDGTSSPVMINCTIADNTAYEMGAGLYQGSFNQNVNAPVLINSIIWNNTLDIAGYGNISNWHTNEPLLVNSIVENGYWGVDMVASDDSGFSDSDNDDYSLSSATSPAVDGGVSSYTYDGTTYTAPTEDRDGNPRDSVIDIGAYEYQ
ncbi:MAG: hypothetical protein HQL52_10465 [Magnetococcales bacterium]|nr:hypothetical protein [Magnetococcales bacterium]